MSSIAKELWGVPKAPPNICFLRPGPTFLGPCLLFDPTLGRFCCELGERRGPFLMLIVALACSNLGETPP